MASFSSSAFWTDAFSALAFDFGGATPPVIITPSSPAGGWKLPLRQWYVEKQGEKKYFDNPEEARNYLLQTEEREVNKKKFKVVHLGKAKIGFAGKNVEDFNIRGKTGLEIIEQGDLRMIRALESMIMRSLKEYAQERIAYNDERDLEILLLLAV